MVRRNRDVAIIVLRCVIFGCCALAQQTAFGTEMAIPPKSASGGYVLVAQADMPVEPQVIVQETRNADAPAEPQAVMQEIKSSTRLSSSKQRRRKPKMAGVPYGSQAVAQETRDTGSQAVAQETRDTGSQAVAQETRDTGSQAVAQRAEETDTQDESLAVAQETKNAKAPASPQAEAKGFKAENLSKKKYGMAPIRWGALVSESIGLEKNSITYHPANGSSVTTQSGGLTNTQTAEIKAQTYVMQQYIARLGGNVGVVSSKNHNTINNTLSASGNRNNQLFGGGWLSLFPQSRFPFNMSFDVRNDSNSTDIQTQNLVTRRLDLNQAYSPMRSKSTYTGGYSRDTRINNSSWSILGANQNDTTTHSLWQGGYTTYTPEHRINANAKYNEKTVSSIQNLRADNFTVSDSYLPTDSLLSLNSTATLNLTSDTDLRARYMQANTNANWQPESEDIPLYLNGSVRLFSMLSTLKGGVTTSSQSLGGNVGARYLFSEKLTGDANSSVTIANSNGIRSLITTQNGNVTYSPRAIRLWEDATYSWNAHGGASNRTQTGGASNQTAGSSDSTIVGGVGHSLGVPYTFNMLDRKFQAVPHINQSLDANLSVINGESLTLINGGGVSLGALLASLNPDKELLGGNGTAQGAVNTTANVSVTDRRVIGGKNPSHSRTYYLMLNLLGGSKSVYRGIELEANMGATQTDAGTELAGTGAATYNKASIFNVRGLDYLGRLRISTRSNSNSRAADVNAQNPKFPWELEQRLRYKIGQNEILLRGLFSDQYGVKNASLWLLFRAWRTIGN